ncbi:MAG: hypothetical protein D6731_17690, partial [Planctomycetota bacterium]
RRQPPLPPSVPEGALDLGPAAAPPPPDQELIETQEDDEPDAFDAPARPFASGGDLADLGDVRFECPYCETRLAPDARSCPRCKKSL